MYEVSNIMCMARLPRRELRWANLICGRAVQPS
jgi:hypothetical protein